MFGYQNFTLSAPHLSGLMQYSIISLIYCSFITRVNTADVTAVLNIIPLKKKKKKSNYIGFLILAVKNWPNTFEVGWNDFWHLILQNNLTLHFYPSAVEDWWGFVITPSGQINFVATRTWPQIQIFWCCFVASFLSLTSVKGQFRKCADRVCRSQPCKPHHPSASPAALTTSHRNAPSSDLLITPLINQQTSKP